MPKTARRPYKNRARMPVDKTIRHSWTRISDYQTCPFMWKMMHLERKAREDNPIMATGRAIHKAIAIYNQHCLDGKLEHDFPYWEKAYKRALKEETLDPEYYSTVSGMMKSYAESHDINMDSAIGAEEKIALTRDFKPTDWLADDVWFRLIIDYLQIKGNLARITDYKAGWLLTTPKMQLKIYAWAVKKVYPQVTDFEVVIDYVRHEHQEIFHITEDELAGIEEEILIITSQIEEDKKHRPKIGIACTYCSCWRWCPAMKEEDIPFMMPKTMEEAQKIAEKVEKYTKLKDEATKVLKEYCNQFGEVETGGKNYGFRPSETWVFKDIPNLIATMDDKGIDIFPCLSVNNTQLKREMRRNEIVKEVVEEIGEKKISVSFTGKKAKPKDDETPEKVADDQDNG